MVRARKGAMSRTTKDKPWWVVATKWEQVHYCRDFGYLKTWLIRQDRPCNLPAEPDLKTYRAWDNQHWRRKSDQCMWEPDYPTGHRFCCPTPPPRWYIEHVWHNPERTRERAYARRALKDYRANGDVEEVLLGHQARSCAKWYYW